jgi:tetratricopeptide (TPR) repeat protein
VLVGLALMKRDLGNIPAARAELEAALREAEGCGDRDSVAIVHHSFLGLEQIAGNVVRGLEHGWVAVATYESPEKRVECMAGLAAALMEYGDRDAAEDAWTLVAHNSPRVHYQIYAHDALGHLAALRGDLPAFERHTARCDALDWESAAPSAKAEILQHRGLSYQALGQTELAVEWLRRAVVFAQEHGFNRVLFEAEHALEAIESQRDRQESTPAPAAPAELREGLRAMRQELVGVGG